MPQKFCKNSEFCSAKFYIENFTNWFASENQTSSVVTVVTVWCRSDLNCASLDSGHGSLVQFRFRVMDQNMNSEFRSADQKLQKVQCDYSTTEHAL